MLDAMELLLIGWLAFFCIRLRQEVAALWWEVSRLRPPGSGPLGLGPPP